MSLQHHSPTRCQWLRPSRASPETRTRMVQSCQTLCQTAIHLQRISESEAQVNMTIRCLDARRQICMRACGFGCVCVHKCIDKGALKVCVSSPLFFSLLCRVLLAATSHRRLQSFSFWYPLCRVLWTLLTSSLVAIPDTPKPPEPAE